MTVTSTPKPARRNRLQLRPAASEFTPSIRRAAAQELSRTRTSGAGPAATANPGEAFIVWGTGLGPVTGDESAGGSAVKIGTVPVEVLVGKFASVIAYARASCCAGLDQIAFYVPAGVTGCSVPVAVKIGNVVSNYVSDAELLHLRVKSTRTTPAM